MFLWLNSKSSNYNKWNSMFQTNKETSMTRKVRRVKIQNLIWGFKKSKHLNQTQTPPAQQFENSKSNLNLILLLSKNLRNKMAQSNGRWIHDIIKYISWAKNDSMTCKTNAKTHQLKFNPIQYSLKAQITPVAPITK